MSRRLILRSIGTLAGLCIGAGAAIAQPYPARPVSLMVPYPAGGPSDAIARIINGALARELG
ncbi:MAG: tripartite tricarboxylate transporter substrate binding protein, partial [Burkholderiales bacterium]